MQKAFVEGIFIASGCKNIAREGGRSHDSEIENEPVAFQQQGHYGELEGAAHWEGGRFGASIRLLGWRCQRVGEETE